MWFLTIKQLSGIHWFDGKSVKSHCYPCKLLLCFDLLTRPKIPFKVMHRKKVTHSNGSYERKSRGRKLADEMGRAKKFPLYTTEWCTGREWPLNCMTVISAWWRLNIRFQRSSGRRTIIYNSVEFDEPVEVASRVPTSWRRDVVRKAASGWRGLWALMSWGPEKLLIRCRKESHHPAEWPLDLRLSIKEQERHNVTAISLESKYYSLCSVSSSLSHANPEQPFRTLAIKWEVNIFVKKSSCVVYYCVFM